MTFVLTRSRPDRRLAASHYRNSNTRIRRTRLHINVVIMLLSSSFTRGLMLNRTVLLTVLLSTHNIRNQEEEHTFVNTHSYLLIWRSEILNLISVIPDNQLL